MSGIFPFHSLLSESSKVSPPPIIASPFLLIGIEDTELSMRRMITLRLNGLGSNRLVPGMTGPKAIGSDGLSSAESPAM